MLRQAGTILRLRPFRGVRAGFLRPFSSTQDLTEEIAATRARLRELYAQTQKQPVVSSSPTAATTELEDRSGDAFDMSLMRDANRANLEKFDVCVQAERFAQQLKDGAIDHEVTSSVTFAEAGMSKEDVMMAIEAGMATKQSYVQARMAAALGHGFYTIGPCGEELMAALGMLLRPDDGMALHYRHVATQIARQLKAGRSVDDILLDRARGHCVSVKDPVCGGSHCAIGGGKFDFVVSSTLASQTPPAVGRALGNSLAHALGIPSLLPKNAVNFVSLGDGSVNNAHFLASVNLAKYARHRKSKVPVVFCVTDNGLSISHKTNDFLSKVMAEGLQMPVYRANGGSLAEIWQQSKLAIESARKNSRPVALIIKDLPRRFGHASTDRQAAYLTQTEIDAHANYNPLAVACAQAVNEGFTTWPELSEMFSRIGASTERAFDKAVREPHIDSRENMLAILSPPHADVPVVETLRWKGSKSQWQDPEPQEGDGSKKKTDVMRKHMTATLDQELARDPSLVYLGEDVEHGGYYLVTDKLAKKYPGRVLDFPPDETTLLGAATGFSQIGMTPIVEIPYAKYLDCGFDQFTELALNHWLTNGQRANGMVIRLQGFGTGVFGGNFHTHNSLYMPPGIDVVCYSNGPDYARGLRYSLEQARAGRVVMLVDSTYLLNLRHLSGRDDRWRLPYTSEGEAMDWDVVRRYGRGARLALVTYGEGVIRCLQAKATLEEKFGVSDVVVIDTPLLSRVPGGLAEALVEFQGVVFADVCKHGQHPYGGFITELQSRNALPTNWNCVTACPTYNPLGCTVTFLSEDDVVEAAMKVLEK